MKGAVSRVNFMGTTSCLDREVTLDASKGIDMSSRLPHPDKENRDPDEDQDHGQDEEGDDGRNEEGDESQHEGQDEYRDEVQDEVHNRECALDNAQSTTDLNDTDTPPSLGDLRLRA